jgi:hypothetical protein
MKRVFLLMVVSALLVTLGFAQTPNVGTAMGQANVQGCLGGSEGLYTVAEDGTRQIFKIAISSVDLKPHLGQNVKLIGFKVSGAASSGTGDGFAVTEVSMISEHCALAAAVPVVTAIPSLEPVIAPAVAAAAPISTVGAPAVDAASTATISPSPAAISTPTADAAAPAANVNPSSATVNTPAANVSPSSATVSTPATDSAAPAATISPSSTTVITPAADAAAPAANTAHPTRRSSHPPRPLATQTAAATAASVRPPSETVTPLATEAANPASAASPSSETAVTPAAAAPTPTATHKGGASLWLMIPFVVLVIGLATLAPFLFRWRKRKILERTDAPNLSLTHEASPDRDKQELRKVA